MKAAVVILGVGAVVVGAVVVWRRSEATQAAAAMAPPSPAETAVVEKAAAAAEPPASAPVESAAAPSGVGFPKNVLSGALATVAAGITLQAAVGNIAELLAGEGVGNVARVAPVGVGLAATAGKGLERGLEALGVGNEVARQAGVDAAVLLVAPGAALAVAGIQAGGKAALAGIGAIFGEGAEQAIGGAISRLDPTMPGSLTYSLVKPVANAVEFLGSAFGVPSIPGLGGPSQQEVAAQINGAWREASLAIVPAIHEYVAASFAAPVIELPPAPPGFVPPKPPNMVPAVVATSSDSGAVVRAVPKGKFRESED